MEKRILILGIGNILLADEGLGPAAVDYLQKNYAWPENVTLVDGATRGLMLMGELLECDLVVVLDIALLGEKPGTFYMLEGDAINSSFASAASMHQTSLGDLLASCDLAGHKPETLVYCMEPFDWQTPQPWLSPEAQEKLPHFCEKVVEELKKFAIVPTKIETGNSRQ